MPNEIHRKLFVAEAAFDFDTVLNSLGDGGIAWCNNVTTCEDCDLVECFIDITVGTGSGGTIEFYLTRTGDTFGAHDPTLLFTDHGNNTTAAQVARQLNLSEFLYSLTVLDADDGENMQTSFYVPHPGADWNLIVYNNTGVAFAASGHQARFRGWGPEVQ